MIGSNRQLPQQKKRNDSQGGSPSSKFVDATQIDDDQLQEALAASVPIKFNLQKRWLKGAEYAHIIRNMNSYCNVFNLELFTPKTHPGSIYMEPQDGMIYFVEGNTIGSDFGFPRLGIKKKYKWKKMNFTTDLPKKNPLVSYIVASAVQCEKFFPENSALGPAFRMHAVILSKDEEIKEPSIERSPQKARARSQSLDVQFQNLKNDQSENAKNNNGKGNVAKNKKKYILCHIRKVNPKIELPDLDSKEDYEMENELQIEDVHSQENKNAQNQQNAKKSVCKQKNGSAVQLINTNKNKSNEEFYQNSSKIDEIDNKEIAIKLSNDQLDKSQNQWGDSTRKSSNTAYMTDQFQNPQGFSKAKVRQRYYTDSYNIQEYGKFKPEKAENKEFSSDPIDKTPTQEGELYALYEDDSEDEDTYAKKDLVQSAESKKRLQKQQRKDNSQRVLQQQYVPKQGGGPFANQSIKMANQALGRKLSYQPRCEPEPEMFQDAQLVKNLMSLNKKFCRMPSDSIGQHQFQSIQGTPQNQLDKLRDYQSPQSQEQYLVRNLVTPKSNRVFRKFSEILSESENSIKSQSIFNSCQSAFKPIDKLSSKNKDDASSLIAPFINSFNLNQPTVEFQNFGNQNMLQQHVSKPNSHDQQYYGQSNNNMIGGQKNTMKMQMNQFQQLLANTSNLFNPLAIVQQQAAFQYQLMLQSQQEILNQNAVLQNCLQQQSEIQRQFPLRKQSSPTPQITNESFLFDRFSRKSTNN